LLCLIYSSDADSDVLADYVLALIRSDAPDDEIKQTSVENLEDFLRESTLSANCTLLFQFADISRYPAICG
jgi:hypothetical protein